MEKTRDRHLVGDSLEPGHLAHTAPVRQDCAGAHVTDGLKMSKPSETSPASLLEPVLVFQGWGLPEQIFSGQIRTVREDACVWGSGRYRSTSVRVDVAGEQKITWQSCCAGRKRWPWRLPAFANREDLSSLKWWRGSRTLRSSQEYQNGTELRMWAVEYGGLECEFWSCPSQLRALGQGLISISSY